MSLIVKENSKLWFCSLLIINYFYRKCQFLFIASNGYPPPLSLLNCLIFSDAETFWTNALKNSASGKKTTGNSR